MNRLTIIIIIISLLMFQFMYGFTAGTYRLFPYSLFKSIANLEAIKPLLKGEPEVETIRSYADTAHKTEVDCKGIDRQKTMVMLAYGQGNAANGGEVKYTPEHNVFNVFDGRCYKAEDPLLGATDNKGSVWGRLADKIIENKMYENVIIKSIAVGGSPIISWTVNGTGRGYKGKLYGNYHARILAADEELKTLGFTITHLLWHQGEADTVNATTRSEYKERFLDMLNSLRKHNISAPIYVALASRYHKQTSQAVICAQIDLIEEHDDILPGPNTDIIDKIDDRTADGQRFSAIGLEKHAQGWLEALQKASLTTNTKQTVIANTNKTAC